MSVLHEVELWRGEDNDAPDKFVPPALSRQWARRDRLERLVSLAVQHPLTLITGSPGAGKTVLLSDWAHSYANGMVWWLSVDEADDEPRQFWRSVITSFRSGGRGAELSEKYWGEVDSRLSVDGVLEQAAQSQPGVLIVDDFHLITNENTVKSVAGLVRRLPPHIRLVVAGRGDPGLSLRRLILTGEASLIGANDLRFTLDECAVLVAQVAHKFLSLSELDAISERSEGWAAGMHMAALALRDHDEPSEFARQFSGTFGPIEEYLENEVIRRQPSDVIRFLLQTSVLEHLDPDLCNAVSGRADAGEILASLAREDLFVVSTSAGERRYRYHRLLADVLQRSLTGQDGHIGREANFRAGCWFERSGDTRAAAHHFGAAGAHERACSSIFPELTGPPAQNVQEVTNRANSSAALLASGPGTDEDHDLRRAYMEAAALICAQHTERAAFVLRCLGPGLADGHEGRLWTARAEFLWAVHADRLGDAGAVLEHCRAAGEVLRLPPEGRPGPVGPSSAGSWTAALDASIVAQLPVLGLRAHVSLGQLEAAETGLSARFATNVEAEASEPGTLAMVAYLAGRLSDAYRLGRAEWQLAQARSSLGPTALSACLAMAEVLYEHDELDLAASQLDEARHECSSGEMGHWAWAVEVEMVRVMIAQQRQREALNRIGQLRQFGVRNPPPHQIVKKLAHVEIGCRLALGDLEGGLVVARSIPPGEISFETMARVDLAAGRPDRALARLNSTRAGLPGDEIRRLVLLACAEMQHGRTLRADDHLGRAVELGRPEGYIRPFVEEAAQVLSLLRVASASHPDPYLTQLIDHAHQAVPAAAVDKPGTILEPLTVREREVLGYLPSHLSVPDIAARIYVSPNTVKSHLKSIYRKMGAASRGDAVTIAVSRGLL